MKKSLIPLTAILSTGLVSAQSSFSLSEFFYNIDPSTMILGVVFLVSFALINFSLGRIFKENPAVSAIVSLCAALLIVYGLNLSGLDYENWLYGIGVSGDLIYTIFLIAAPIIGMFILFRYGLGYLLLSLGALLGIMSYFAYDKIILIILATISIIIGIFLIMRKRFKRYPTQRVVFGRYTPIFV